nr:hypothetical protein [Tanacetum cinerariifolium]
MVTFLSKPTESNGFEQIVDFLNAHPIRYALTVNPTIYISYIKQFWSTAMAKTINKESQLQACVDGKKIIITKASIRIDLQLADEKGVDCLPNSTIFEQLALMSTMASAIICLATSQKFNFSKWIFDSMIRYLDNVSEKFLMYLSLGAEHDSGNINKTQSKATPTESSSQRTNSGGGPRCQENIRDTTTQTRVLELEKTKTYQHNKIASLKRRVKKLKKRNRSRTHKLKRLYKVGLTARVESLDDEESLGGEEVFDAAGQIVNVVNITTEGLNLAQALEALKTSKLKIKGLVIQELSESTTTTISSQQSQDKGKGIMIEEPMKAKKKDPIRLDEEAAKRLQAEFNEEERLVRKKAKKEQEANIALIETWNDIQANINVDYQLAKRLQAQE